MHDTTQVETLRDLSDPAKQAAFDQCLVDRAADLGRNGSLKQAEQLLRPLLMRPHPSSSCLDLMARICAQEGRLGEAEVMWTSLLEREPNHRAAGIALARIHHTQRLASRMSSPGGRLALVAAMVSIPLMVGFVAFWLAGRTTFTTSQQTATRIAAWERDLTANKPQSPPSPPAEDSLVKRIDTLTAAIIQRDKETTARLDRLEGQLGRETEATASLAKILTDVEQRLTEAGNARDRTTHNTLDGMDERLDHVLESLNPEPPALAINENGVFVCKVTGGWIVSLVGDSFSPNGSLLRMARIRLNRIAASLAADPCDWRIEALAFPFPEGADDALARQRATRAANHLAESKSVAHQRILARSGTTAEFAAASVNTPRRDPSHVLALRFTAPLLPTIRITTAEP